MKWDKVLSSMDSYNAYEYFLKEYNKGLRKLGSITETEKKQWSLMDKYGFKKTN